MKVAFTIISIFFGSNAALARPSEVAGGDEIIPLDDEFQKATLATPPHELDHWENWERWNTPAKIAKLAPFYKAGYDLDRLPLFVIEFGNWNYRELAKLSQNELDAFYKHYEQNIRRMSKDAAANNYQGTALIMDWDGFELAHFATTLKLTLKSFTSAIPFNRAIKYVASINTNFAAESFINLARPFVGELLEKFAFYGTQSEKWKPALLRKIPQDQLPPKYGGNDGWKAMPLS